jgi:Putative adhesin Stv domain
MARAFLLSHGTRVGSVGDTFVPPGRTIAFYSEFDENTLRTIGLAALNAGDITPTETFEGGSPVPNYGLPRFSDGEMAEHLASVSSQTNGTLYFTGAELPDPAWLCTTPDKCATTRPEHHADCRGVFALVAEQDILSVSCRGLQGASGTSTFEMEGSTEFMDEMMTEARRIVDWAQTDPEAAMQYYQSLSEATRVQLNGANTNLKTWAESYFSSGGTDTAFAVTEALSYLESHGDVAFADYADQWEQGQRSVAFADERVLDGYWLGYGRRMLQREGAPAFWTFFVGLDRQWQDLLSADPQLADAIAIGSQGGGVAEAGTWQPSEGDFATAASVNQPFVKGLDEGVEAVWEVAAFILLVGQPDIELAYRLRQQPDYATGTFRVERALMGAGSLVFSGVPPMHQGTVEAAIAQFSQKEVTFA